MEEQSDLQPDLQPLKKRRFVNMIFIGLFLFEIALYIIGIIKLPTNTYYLLLLFFIIFASGIYTVSNFFPNEILIKLYLIYLPIFDLKIDCQERVDLLFSLLYNQSRTKHNFI